jgi:hypothetical protein
VSKVCVELAGELVDKAGGNLKRFQESPEVFVQRHLVLQGRMFTRRKHKYMKIP